MIADDLRRSIIKKLSNLFPFPVYSEEVESGFEVPCIFVTQVTFNQMKLIHPRYDRVESYDIAVYENSIVKRKEIADILYEELEIINSVWGAVRSNTITENTLDRALHLAVNYRYQVVQEQPEGTKMQTLTQKGTIKNGR